MAFTHLTKREKPKITNLYEINGIIESIQTEALPRNLQEHRDLVLFKVPDYYHSPEELEVFNKEESDILPKYTPLDYKIELENEHKPSELGINPLYRITLTELEEYRKYITENL